MTKTRRTLVVALAAFWVMFFSGVTAAQACTLNQCGVIHVMNTSQRGIVVTYQFGDPWSSYARVPIGGSSTSYGRDADGFLVEAGQDVTCIFNSRDVRHYAATGWKKVNDLERPQCRSYAA